MRNSLLTPEVTAGLDMMSGGGGGTHVNNVHVCMGVISASTHTSCLSYFYLPSLPLSHPSVCGGSGAVPLTCSSLSGHYRHNRELL